MVAVSLDGYILMHLLLPLKLCVFDSLLPQLENEGDNPHATLNIQCNNVCVGFLNIINYFACINYC